MSNVQPLEPPPSTKNRNFFQKKFAFFDRVAAAPVDAETDWTEIAFLPKKTFLPQFF